MTGRDARSGVRSAAPRRRDTRASALARSPDAAEIDRSLSYLAAAASEYNLSGDAWKSDPRPWRDLAVALFNLKEFLYIL